MTALKYCGRPVKPGTPTRLTRRLPPADTGNAIYGGRRDLGGGIEAVMLHAGDETLVKVVTSKRCRQ